MKTRINRTHFKKKKGIQELNPMGPGLKVSEFLQFIGITELFASILLENRMD
jgi:hypothetical protein